MPLSESLFSNWSQIEFDPQLYEQMLMGKMSQQQYNTDYVY